MGRSWLGAGTTNSGSAPQYGQAIVPGGLSNVVAIAGGGFHSLALKADGTVVVWGAGTTNSGSTPQYGQAIVPVGLSNVIAIAGGGFHSLALKTDGTVVAWGAGTNNSGSTPQYGQAIVPVGLSNVVAIAAGGYHSLALKADGTVVAWGAGTNNTGSAPSYGQSMVPPGLSHVVAIAAGRYYSIALKTDGTTIAWGDNTYSQTNPPVTLLPVTALACGGYHDLAFEGDGHPHFTVQPLSQTALAGLTIQLAAMAVGLQPLNYQWQCNGTNLPGATNGLLSLANLQCSNAGAYTLLVTNSLGAATSAPALVSVQAPPVINLQPSAQTVVAGAAAAFSVAAVGSPPLTYQWSFNGSNIIGATQTAFSLAAAQPANAGNYSVQVTNAFGVAVSSNATLTVLVPPAITTQPSNQTATVGAKSSFTVTATGTAPLAYQWAFDGTSLVGATDGTLLLTNVQPAQAGSYAVVITNVVGSITSSVATLTVLSTGAIINLSSVEPTISISFPSQAGSNYVLEYKNTLADLVWTPLPPVVTGTGGIIVLQDTNPPVTSRFYRVLRE